MTVARGRGNVGATAVSRASTRCKQRKGLEVANLRRAPQRQVHNANECGKPFEEKGQLLRTL